jgi:hypothetical protein
MHWLASLLPMDSVNASMASTHAGCSLSLKTSLKAQVTIIVIVSKNILAASEIAVEEHGCLEA